MDTDEEVDNRLYAELFGDHHRVYADLVAAPDENDQNDNNNDQNDGLDVGMEMDGLLGDEDAVPAQVLPSDLDALYRAHLQVYCGLTSHKRQTQNADTSEYQASELEKCVTLAHEAADAVDECLPIRPYTEQEGNKALSLVVVGGAYREICSRHPPVEGAMGLGGELEGVVGVLVTRVEQLLVMYPEQPVLEQVCACVHMCVYLAYMCVRVIWNGSQLASRCFLILE